jgi:hypothetical protein
MTERGSGRCTLQVHGSGNHVTLSFLHSPVRLVKCSLIVKAGDVTSADSLAGVHCSCKRGHWIAVSTDGSCAHSSRRLQTSTLTGSTLQSSTDLSRLLSSEGPPVDPVRPLLKLAWIPEYVFILCQ